MNDLRQRAKEIAALMAQMANENRLLILCALLDGPKTVGQLSRQVPGITGPALSQHLHKLREGGLINSEKQAQYVTYFIQDERLRDLMEVLKQKYCTESL